MKTKKPNAEIVLAALRQNAEGARMANKDGSVWADVYLDNARPAEVTLYAWRAALGLLAKQGLYKVVDGWAWGSVRMGCMNTPLPDGPTEIGNDLGGG